MILLLILALAGETPADSTLGTVPSDWDFGYGCLFEAQALGRIRDRSPEMDSTGFDAALFVTAYLAIAGAIAWDDPLTAMIGIGIVGTGVPFFLIWRKVKS